MTGTGAGAKDEGQPWGSRAITSAEATAFAAKVTMAPHDQAIIARNLADFPPSCSVRGVFFEGLARSVAQQRGEAAVADIVRRAGLPAQTTAFRLYPHRDFYKLYYLAARLLHPNLTFGAALRRVGRGFFPIFRASMLGKTMGALMGDEPRTILPLLARAYGISVEGNEHEARLVGEGKVAWRCRVEPVEWYVETFTGIVEGAMPADARRAVEVTVDERRVADGAAHYAFTLTF